MYLILLSLLAAAWFLRPIYEHPIKMAERVAVHVMRRVDHRQKLTVAQLLCDLFGYLGIPYPRRLLLFQSIMPPEERSWFAALNPVGYTDDQDLFSKLVHRVLSRTIPEHLQNRLASLRQIGLDMGLGQDEVDSVVDVRLDEYLEA